MPGTEPPKLREQVSVALGHSDLWDFVIVMLIIHKTLDSRWFAMFKLCDSTKAYPHNHLGFQCSVP